MNRVFLTPAAVALCGASSLSLAEPVSLADQVVTATRTAQTASQSLAAVSVIDREDIERSQARSVPELLRQVPGVSLANNGGFGKNTTLFLRGTESDHVLVLIDGIKVGSASAGLTAFQDLPVELIERVEAVRLEHLEQLLLELADNLVALQHRAGAHLHGVGAEQHELELTDNSVSGHKGEQDEQHHRGPK